MTTSKVQKLLNKSSIGRTRDYFANGAVRPFLIGASNTNRPNGATIGKPSTTAHHTNAKADRQQTQGRPSQTASHDGAFAEFDMSDKPSPSYFYAGYGMTLKGKQTNFKCCFHDDKTPSLSINADTGAFYCFGCGISGGDVIDFYMKYHGCDFITACKALNIRTR